MKKNALSEGADLKSMKKAWASSGMALVVVLLAIQLVPKQQSNPAVTSEMPASPELKTLLKRSCYDCHSNETVWPWYAQIAPISWWIGGDVKEGRRELNFSTWNLYSPSRKAKKLQEVQKQIEQGKMPLWYYLLAHPEARLSASDQDLILKWAKQPD